MRNLALVWVLVGVAVALLAAGDGKPSVSTYTDKRDGKVYKIVKIGRQYWFAENLNYDTAGSVCYDNKAENCDKYGRLYNWETALKACPAGYHLPFKKEWIALENYAGGEKTADTKLKSTSGGDKNGNGTDDFGFAAFPGGYGNDSGNFGNAGYYGFWWSATEYDANLDWDDADLVWNRCIGYDFECLRWYYDGKTSLFSVRCVVDDEKERRK
jgi:uncharacterized protein (TIGR02145 family)